MIRILFHSNESKLRIYLKGTENVTLRSPRTNRDSDQSRNWTWIIKTWIKRLSPLSPLTVIPITDDPDFSNVIMNI